MEFSDYLSSKKIDEKAFQNAEKERFEEWKLLFEQVHSESFTMQKKFYLNDIRRKYKIS
jgi:hypothetical protein